MKALATFRTPPYLHNCAQAIAYRWHHLYPQGDAIVGIYAPYKGGQAPEGLCGALYASMQALPEKAEQIKEEFRQRLGAVHCRDLKGKGVPCPLCVDTADTLVSTFASPEN